jgi:hypothetical protein
MSVDCQSYDIAHASVVNVVIIAHAEVVNASKAGQHREVAGRGCSHVVGGSLDNFVRAACLALCCNRLTLVTRRTK